MSKRRPVVIADDFERCAHISELLGKYEQRLVRHICAQLKADGSPLPRACRRFVWHPDPVAAATQLAPKFGGGDADAAALGRLQLSGLREGRHLELFKAPIADHKSDQTGPVHTSRNKGAGKARSRFSHMNNRRSEPT